MKTKQIIIAVALMLVLIGALLAVYFIFLDKPAEGEKNIVVEIVFADGTKQEHEIKTEAEYLRGALDEAKLIAGRDDGFGFYITAVANVTADDSKQEWWCITRGGETVMTGVDSTPIYDGERYELTLTVGYGDW